MKKTIALLLALTIPSVLLTQESIDQELLRQDLDVLKANLEAYHTGLYTYTTQAEFENWYADTKKNLKDTSSHEFFKKINELNGLIRNGHTFFHINPEQRGKDLQMPAFKVYKDGEAFFIRECQDPKLIGKQIIAINNLPVTQVFDVLLKYEERDGNNLSQPTEELLFSFARKFALEYGNSAQTELKILDGGKTRLVVLKTIPFEEVTQKTDYLFDHGGVEFSIKDSIAVLTVQTFNKVPLKKAQYTAKLKTLFKEIAANGLNHLIIDVRNNGGGHTESVEELISFLYDEEFVFYSDVYRQHKNWDTSLIPELSQYPKNISSWAHKQGDDGYYRAIAGRDGMKKLKPKKNQFKGKLYVLINGSTLSAAAEFASFIKQYREAVFIGDEAGGNKTQNTSGDWLIIGLPHSKVFAFIPYVLWKMNVTAKNDGHGVQPDYYIKNSIQEEIQGQDAVLQFTKELIAGTSNK